MILLYTDMITQRLIYASRLVFETVMGIECKLTSDKEYFKTYNHSKISYSKEKDLANINILPHRILFENDIKDFVPFAEKQYLNFPKFFKTEGEDFLGFDVFAMVFYFASRYEEYLKTELDQHQRYKAENSIAFQYNCLHIPFLNKAISFFQEKLKNEFPQIEFKDRKFNFLSTIDIDNAFAFAYKGFKRNLGGLAKDVMSFNFLYVINRINSNINSDKDPYNTFKLIHSLSEETQTALQYFVLIGDYSAYDKNPHHTNKGFRKLLKQLSLTNPIGLHPSYQAYSDFNRIGIEKKRLEDIIEKPITSARCHFLRVNMPNTYRAFIEAGITDDYTMIYASQCGFRTGLCTPYPWFDLEKNEITSLIIHPSTVMEGVLRDYNKLSIDNANSVVLNLMHEVKNNNGEFVAVWHNDSFVPQQKQWVDLYKRTLVNSKNN